MGVAQFQREFGKQVLGYLLGKQVLGYFSLGDPHGHRRNWFEISGGAHIPAVKQNSKSANQLSMLRFQKPRPSKLFNFAPESSWPKLCDYLPYSSGYFPIIQTPIIRASLDWIGGPGNTARIDPAGSPVSRLAEVEDLPRRGRPLSSLPLGSRARRPLDGSALLQGHRCSARSRRR